MAATHAPREWAGDSVYDRRAELFARAAPVFEVHGYRGASLKAIAAACGMSIPGLYRYFPSKRALALYPLRSMYPELHPPAPDVSTGDPGQLLAAWIDGAVGDARNYVLAASLLGEVGLTDDERAAVDAGLVAHIELLASVARRAAPHLPPDAGRELVEAMLNLALAPAMTGIASAAPGLRRQLRVLVRSYGIALP